MKIEKFTKKIMIIATMLVVMFTFKVSSFAGSVTSPPQFMPGFPMLAGENIMAMWVPVPGATKYIIYQNDKSIGEAPVPPFTAPAPKEPGVYNYTIVGVDATGAEGPKSNPVTISIIILEPPKGIRSQFLGDILNLAWDEAPNAAIYDIFRSDTTKEGPYKLISSVSDLKYVDSDVKQSESAEKSFFYKVVSKDKFNKQSPESEVHLVKVEKIIITKEVADVSLKIMRTKQVMIAKPMGGGNDIGTCGGSKFLSNGNLVYTDAIARRVAIIDKAGDFVKMLGEYGPKPDQYTSPTYIAVDKDDSIYFVDSNKYKIFAYDSSGSLLYAVDVHVVKEKEALSKMPDPTKPLVNVNPKGIAIYKDSLYVVDLASGTIQIYKKEDGSFVGYLTNKKTGLIPNFGGPTLLSLSSDGKLYVARAIERIINVINIETGEPLYDIGTSKTFIGAFIGISGMGFDKDENLIATDSAMQTVQVFSKTDGSYMYHIGDVKAVPDPKGANQRPYVRGMDYPLSVNADPQGRLWIYVGISKGFMVRSYIGDKPWDIKVDKSEE